MNKKNLLLNLSIICLVAFNSFADSLPAAEEPLADTALVQESKALEAQLAEIPDLNDVLQPLQQQTEPEETATHKQASLFDQLPSGPEDVTLPAIAEQEAQEQAPVIAVHAPQVQVTETRVPVIQPKKQKPVEKKLVAFDFENEDLTKVINKFASLQNRNIILPSGAQAITQKVTFKLKKKIPLEQAERYFGTLLDIAGYSIVPHGDFYLVAKNDPVIVREQLPLFVDVPPQNLPDQGRIQVIYYLQNIKVPENPQGMDSLNIILNDMLSPNKSYSFDVKSNAVIISDKASNIKATMSMILELDSMGVRDVIQTIQLFNVSAVNVANIMQTQILAVSGTPQGKIRAEVKSEAGLYFAPGTRIVGDSRTNSLIIMGKEPAVERVIEFVRDYVDVPLESGKSILHYYELQYLDAENFAEVLKKIVVSQGLSGQATTDQSGGPSRTFEGVIIVPEKPVEEVVEKLKLAESNAAPGSQSILKGSVYRGGNRIIVAAKNRDWKRIEKLIQDLDKPQYQVVIQIMIVDFEVTSNKIFGTQTRNPSFFQLPDGFSFQTTNLVAPPIPFTYPNNTLGTDLLALIAGVTPPASEAALLTNNVANSTGYPGTGNPGSLILSVNDPAGTGIWTFLKWLDSFGETRILSNPYLVARNNQKAEEIISTIKRVVGDASTGEGGLLAAKQQEIEAALKVSVVPRVSSKDRVNLQISVSINNFIGGNTTNSTTNNSVTTRELHTDVNMGSGQMLVLGGLTESSVSETDNETPLLGRIPVIRWFFSSNEKATDKTNVTMFIIPTIIEPKIRAGQNKFTRDKITECYDDVENGDLFDQMKDPVTYLFFKGQNLSADMLDEYLSDTEGDFVRRDRVEKRRGPIRKENTAAAATTVSYKKHCAGRAQHNQEPVEKNIITHDSHHLKKVLATERNPLLNSQKNVITKE